MTGYEKLYKKIYEKSGLVTLLKLVGDFSVVLTVTAYLFLLVFSTVGGGIFAGIEYLLLAGVPFLFVSLFRHYFSAPRPYEIYDFAVLGIAPPKEKCGHSFPSRHVFSAFLIGMLLFSASPILGGVVLFFGAALAACRVLLGIHFLRDCIAGAAIGLLSGGLGIFLITIL